MTKIDQSDFHAFEYLPCVISPILVATLFLFLTRKLVRGEEDLHEVEDVDELEDVLVLNVAGGQGSSLGDNSTHFKQLPRK